MNGKTLEQQSSVFSKKMEAVKAKINPSFPWYPYGSLNNFIHLKNIFDKYPLDSLAKKGSKTLDIGAADGDLAFFLESLGYQADIIDYPPTNFNHLQGAKHIKQHLGSLMDIREADLDSQFPALTQKYSLIFFLGILYHLKNPYFVLETLSRSTEYLLVSTRIAKYTKDGTKISSYPVAYLLGPQEANNDSTNYWIFSYKGLERIFERTGWTITEMYSVGDTSNSNPSDQDHDERAFALLKSKNFQY
ncbi:MAG TPA: methyltransferase domain-containing protein [Puia sp.]|jgi:2-polyprenyl-3-methyl-5-hydroxy-6-metoxy-1,4-benzoquinol methylase|nr:methyltransferase domain-containing protein [Puia sp.]